MVCVSLLSRIVFIDEPLSQEIPSYYEVIERPMDFQTLERLLKNGAYDTIEQFKDDVDVIFSNCTYFNQRDTIYYKEAIRMQK